MTDRDAEGLAGCAVAVMFIFVSLGFYGLAAWGAQYVAAELFQKQLPFWPLFVGIWVVGFVLKKARSVTTTGVK